MIKFWVFIILFCLSLLAVNADIIVNRNHPETLLSGEILTVDITLINNAEYSENLKITQTITSGYPIYPSELIRDPNPGGVKFGARPPYYKWDIVLAPKSEEIIKFKIRYNSPGEIYLSQTAVETSTGEKYYSEPSFVTISNPPNGVCEPELGENSRNSPEDCQSGSKDDICDLGKDGVCDPDCIPETDPDCAEKSREFPTTTLIITAIIIIILVTGFLLFRKKK